ncbi:MAG: hypothetical protein MUC71_12205 [Steroidobacteraceae bacterium]|jgi:hypothetical protein|nr:hypothetical protein [Steroidobacteraceae bacterium]
MPFRPEPFLALLLALPAAADAQATRRGASPPDPMLDHTISVTGGLGIASSETVIRYDASDGTPGTELSAEEDLGFDDQEMASRLEITLRPRKRHRIRLGLVALPGERSARQVIEEDIRFGDDVYLPGETVESKLRLRAWSASYGYSFVRQPRVEFGVSVGVTSIGLLAEAGVPARGLREREEQTVPAPQVGADVSFRISPRWYAEARYQYFEVSADDTNGRLTQLDAAVMFQVNPNLALGLGWSAFDGDVELREVGDSGVFRQRTDSFLLQVRAGL